MNGEIAARDETVMLDGLRFHYCDWGKPDAPPLVLLHGYTSHVRSWDTFAHALADRFRVLALDNPRGFLEVAGCFLDGAECLVSAARRLLRLVSNLARRTTPGTVIGGAFAIATITSRVVASVTSAIDDWNLRRVLRRPGPAPVGAGVFDMAAVVFAGRSHD